VTEKASSGIVVLAPPSEAVAPSREAITVAVREVIESLRVRVPILQRHYDAALSRNRRTRGVIRVRTEIGSDGLVRRVCILESGLRDRTLQADVVRSIGTWHLSEEPLPTALRIEVALRFGDAYPPLLRKEAFELISNLLGKAKGGRGGESFTKAYLWAAERDAYELRGDLAGADRDRLWDALLAGGLDFAARVDIVGQIAMPASAGDERGRRSYDYLATLDIDSLRRLHAESGFPLGAVLIRAAVGPGGSFTSARATEVDNLPARFVDDALRIATAGDLTQSGYREGENLMLLVRFGRSRAATNSALYAELEQYAPEARSLRAGYSDRPPSLEKKPGVGERSGTIRSN
jgi:hypothetical protein